MASFNPSRSVSYSARAARNHPGDPVREIGGRRRQVTFTGFTRDIWAQIWSNNPYERLDSEIGRRTESVGIFPSRDSIIRLVGAVLAEQTDEWAEDPRYLALDVLTRSRMRLVPIIKGKVVADNFIARTV